MKNRKGAPKEVRASTITVMMQRHTLVGILVLFIAFTFSANTTFAAFNDIGVGARPLGLGGAFVALADDSNAAHYNAAGLGYIDAIHVGATREQRFNGLVTYNAFGGVVPMGMLGSIGAHIGILTEDSEIYQEQTLLLSYGKAFLKQFSIGANLKRFGTSFDETNEFVAGNDYFTQTSASAVSVDVGVIVKPVTGLSIGVAAENLVPADMSVSEAFTDAVPRNIRAGMAYRLESIAAMSAQGATVSNILKSGLATLEVAMRDGDTHVRVGAEFWLSQNIAARGGYGVKSGVDSASTIALGTSLKIPISATDLQLDYGFQLLTGTFQDNTTQRFSVNLRF